MSEHNGLRHFVPSAVRSFHLWPLVSKMGLYNFYRRRKFKDSLISLDVVITECCTLRCRNCANLMQYYHNPENTDADETIAAAEDYNGGYVHTITSKISDAANAGKAYAAASIDAMREE